MAVVRGAAATLAVCKITSDFGEKTKYCFCFKKAATFYESTMAMGDITDALSAASVSGH